MKRSPSARPTRLAAAVALVAALAGCAGDEARPRNLVVLVVDSLRADRLGAYGGPRPTSPSLDALSREGARFERAYVPAPWTQPSVASFFTGLHPSEHGLTQHGRVLADALETLPERLRSLGYRTAGVVSHKLLSDRYRFDQGFELFDQRHGQGHAYVSTAGVTEVALEYLDELAAGDAPFLLFVHWFDPHYRYVDHASLDWAPARAGRLDGSRGMQALRELLDTLTAEEVDFLEARYDEEIRITDGGIGRLLERLDELDLASSTVVAFTADHGEEFLAHGWLGHTRTLYDELVRVPLVLRGPGIPAGSVVDDLVSLVALPGTLLDLGGHAAAAASFPGGSFADVATGRGGGARHVFAEVDFVDKKQRMKSVHKKAVATERWKLVRDEESGEVELYDLDADPHELADLAGARLDVVAELLAELERHLASLDRDPSLAVDTELSIEELEELEALGYAGGDGDE